MSSGFALFCGISSAVYPPLASVDLSKVDGYNGEQGVPFANCFPGYPSGYYPKPYQPGYFPSGYPQGAWPFPAAGEAVADGWDGTWSQSGENVTVNAASWNANLAANGGSTTIGFNGTDTGQDTAPTVFYINNTICGNDCAMPHSMEATTKPATATSSTRLRPKRPASQPEGGVMMAAATI